MTGKNIIPKARNPDTNATPYAGLKIRLNNI
jgi:hypothetical protein